MRIIFEADLVTHLNALGLRAGVNVVVHSRLLSFGRIEGGVSAVYRAIMSVIGETGTLVVPAYTLGIDPNACFDFRATPSRGVGAFSEYVRMLPSSIRSGCPIHSHAAIGPHASVLNESDRTVSLGSGSDFDVMQRAGFELLLLGCDFHEGATFVHHVEAMIGVPYRSWIDLPCRVTDSNGAPVDIVVRYFGKAKDGNIVNDLRGVERQMLTGGWATSAPIAGGNRSSILMPLDKLDRCVRDMIAADPYVLVRARNAVAS